MNGWKTYSLAIVAMICSTVALSLGAIDADIWQGIMITALSAYTARTVADKFKKGGTT